MEGRILLIRRLVGSTGRAFSVLASSSFKACHCLVFLNKPGTVWCSGDSAHRGGHTRCVRARGVQCVVWHLYPSGHLPLQQDWWLYVTARPHPGGRGSTTWLGDVGAAPCCVGSSCCDGSWYIQQLVLSAIHKF